MLAFEKEKNEEWKRKKANIVTYDILTLHWFIPALIIGVDSDLNVLTVGWLYSVLQF